MASRPTGDGGSHSNSSASISTITFKVYGPNSTQGVNTIKCAESSIVEVFLFRSTCIQRNSILKFLLLVNFFSQEAIAQVTERLAPGPRAYQALYGLRVVEAANPRGPHYWLDNTSPLSQVQERFAIGMIGANESKWRVELRIRCVPKDLHELYSKDKSTFIFYYDQVSQC